MNKAIICDIDGTLALRNGRGPFEHEKSNEDKVCQSIKNLLNIYKNNGYSIIILTGREDRFKEITQNWLRDKQIIYDNIFFRETKDQRKDCLVKKELYDTHILNKYEIDFVLDDRDQVVKMWRNELKLKCFQVNYGKF